MKYKTSSPHMKLHPVEEVPLDEAQAETSEQRLDGESDNKQKQLTKPTKRRGLCIACCCAEYHL